MVYPCLSFLPPNQIRIAGGCTRYPILRHIHIVKRCQKFQAQPRVPSVGMPAIEQHRKVVIPVKEANLSPPAPMAHRRMKHLVVADFTPWENMSQSLGIQPDCGSMWIYYDLLNHIYIYHTVNHNNSILLSWSCQHGSHWLAAQHLSHHQENRVDELEIFGENEEANPKASLTSPSTWILQGFGLASGNMAIEIVNFPIKNGDFPVMGQFTRG